MSKSKTLAESHDAIVRELQERGEQIFRPPCMEHTWPDHDPIVYVKNHFPLVCGHASRREDGTYDLIHDMLAYWFSGFKFEQLGLCDAHCWYERKRIDEWSKGRPVQPSYWDDRKLELRMRE